MTLHFQTCFSKFTTSWISEWTLGLDKSLRCVVCQMRVYPTGGYMMRHVKHTQQEVAFSPYIYMCVPCMTGPNIGTTTGSTPNGFQPTCRAMDFWMKLCESCEIPWETRLFDNHPADSWHPNNSNCSTYYVHIGNVYSLFYMKISTTRQVILHAGSKPTRWFPPVPILYWFINNINYRYINNKF